VHRWKMICSLQIDSFTPHPALMLPPPSMIQSKYLHFKNSYQSTNYFPKLFKCISNTFYLTASLLIKYPIISSQDIISNTQETCTLEIHTNPQKLIHIQANCRHNLLNKESFSTLKRETFSWKDDGK